MSERDEMVPPSGKVASWQSTFSFWFKLFRMHDNSFWRSLIKATLVKVGAGPVRLYP